MFISWNMKFQGMRIWSPSPSSCPSSLVEGLWKGQVFVVRKLRGKKLNPLDHGNFPCWPLGGTIFKYTHVILWKNCPPLGWKWTEASGAARANWGQGGNTSTTRESSGRMTAAWWELNPQKAGDSALVSWLSRRLEGENLTAGSRGASQITIVMWETCHKPTMERRWLKSHPCKWWFWVWGMTYFLHHSEARASLWGSRHKMNTSRESKSRLIKC